MKKKNAKYLKQQLIRGNEDCMRINKISAKMIKGCDAEAACRELSEYYDIIRHESGSGIAGTTIELVPKGFNKAVGISAVCRLFDVPWEDTIVFGDSNNDLYFTSFAGPRYNEYVIFVDFGFMPGRSTI